jgi:hypothetical protein
MPQDAHGSDEEVTEHTPAFQNTILPKSRTRSQRNRFHLGVLHGGQEADLVSFVKYRPRNR